MDKLKLAHEWYMKHSESASHMDFDVKSAWQYADAMQAEADERNKAEAEQKRKEIREILNDANTFIEREGQHFDDVADIQKPYTSSEEWQLDWNQAPNDATAWEYLGYGAARWHTTTKGMYRAADLFGYSGTDMLLVERPDGF